MIQEKDRLFALIKSLSKTEKRYLKVYASRHVKGQKNNYLKLFDLMDKMKGYDDEIVRRFLQKEKIKKSKGGLRHYLYKLIIRSLNEFRVHGSMGSQLAMRIREIEILSEQGLHAPATEELASVKKMAYAWEDYPQVLTLIKIEKRLLAAKSYKDVTPNILESMLQEEQEVMRIYNNRCAYDALARTILLPTFHQGSPRQESDMEPYTRMLEHVLLQSADTALSFYAKQYYYLIRVHCLQAKLDYANAFLEYQQIIPFTDSNPLLLKESPAAYFNFHTHYIAVCLFLKKKAEALRMVQKMKQALSGKGLMRNPVSRARIFMHVHASELNVYTESGDFEHAHAVLGKIEQEMAETGSYLQTFQRMKLHFNAALLCFLSGRHKPALRWLNHVLNSPEDFSNQLQAFARILNLMIHFELGNHDMIEHAVKSSYRFLSKKEQLYRCEQALLDFIRVKVPRIFSEADQIRAFAELQSVLLALSADPFENASLQILALIPWLESKVSGRKVDEVLSDDFV